MSMLYSEYTFRAFKKLLISQGRVIPLRKVDEVQRGSVSSNFSVNAACTAIKIEIYGACARMQCGMRLVAVVRLHGLSIGPLCIMSQQLLQYNIRYPLRMRLMSVNKGHCTLASYHPYGRPSSGSNSTRILLKSIPSKGP